MANGKKIDVTDMNQLGYTVIKDARTENECIIKKHNIN